MRRRAARGNLAVEGDVIEIGQWWDTGRHNEIDALVLAGYSGEPVLDTSAAVSPGLGYSRSMSGPD